MSNEGVDWSAFEFAMFNASFLHGEAVFKDEPRMPLQAVLDNLDDGMTPDEVASAYQIDQQLVTAVKEFAESQRLANPVR